MPLKKNKPQIPTEILIDKCFRLTFFSPVKSLLCSLPSVLEFWKFLFLQKPLAKLPLLCVNCRWVFVSNLGLLSLGAHQPCRIGRWLVPTGSSASGRGLGPTCPVGGSFTTRLSSMPVALSPPLVGCGDALAWYLPLQGQMAAREDGL